MKSSVNIFGRLSVHAGPLSRTFAAFSVYADGQGTAGTLTLKGYVGLPTLDPGKAIPVGAVSGSGTFNGAQFQLDGKFKLNAAPLAFATGRFHLDPKSGLSVQAHYVGIQAGPLGLGADINPTGNQTATDSPQTRYADSQHVGETSGAQGVFTPGVSYGYSYIRYSPQNRLVLSAGIAPAATVVPYYANGVSTPAIPLLGSLGIGPKGISDGVYFGALLSGTF